MKARFDTLSGADTYRIAKATREVMPKILPPRWESGATYENARDWFDGDLRVLAEVELVDGALWLHVSMSRRGRLPSWEDLRFVKDVVIGRDRKALQILPSADEYVNIHPHVLHLYAALERDLLPDFRMTQTDGVVGI